MAQKVAGNESPMDRERAPMDEEEEMESFLTMERLFSSLANSLFNDRSLDNFRQQYEELHFALVQSRERNQVLTQKCRQLNSDIVSNANKVASVVGLSQGDSRAIASPRPDFERAWRLVSCSQERENRSREVIRNLTIEAENLRQMIEQSQGHLTDPQQISKQLVKGSLTSLSNEIELSEKEKDQLTIELNETAQEIRLAQKSIGSLNKEIKALADESEKLNQTSEDLRLERNELTKQGDDVRRGISNIQHNIEHKDTLFARRSEEVRNKEKESRQISKELSVWQDALAGRRRDHEKMSGKLSEKCAANNAL
jgi:chromosome segregation ATPase